MRQKLLLGCDGGGTKTLCALARPDGTVVGVGAGGPSNLSTHWESAPGAVLEGVAGAARGLGAPPELAAACLAFAGYHGCGHPQGPEEGLRGVVEAEHFQVISDQEAAFLGAAGGGPAVVVIAGTGAAVYGGDSAGGRARAAGWGYLLDDEGSGFWIGLQALRAALRHYDGRGPETALTEALVRHLRIPDPEGIERFVFSLDSPTTPIAALAPLVLEVAEAGDSVAGELLQEAGRHLAEGAWAVLRRLKLDEEPVVVACVGSILAAEGPVRPALSRWLAEAAPRAALGDPLLPPVAGALIAAARAAAIPVDAAFLGRLGSSLDAAGP